MNLMYDLKRFLFNVIVIFGSFGIFLWGLYISEGIQYGKWDNVDSNTGVYSWLFLVCGILLIGLGVKKIAKGWKKNRYKRKINYQDMSENFIQFYENITHEINKNDKKRSTIITILGINLLYCIIGIGGFILLNKIITTVEMTSFIQGILVLTSLIPAFLITSLHEKKKKKKEEYRDYYKSEVISELVTLVDSSFQYSILDRKSNNSNNNNIRTIGLQRKDGQYIPIRKEDMLREILSQDGKYEYKHSDLETEKYNRFFSEDYITGWNDNFKMYEIKLQDISNYSKTPNFTFQIFHGLFCSLITNINFDAAVKVRKNKLKILPRNQRVEMHLTEFEKYFDVYCENEMVAKQYLTTDLMNLLVNFYEKYNLQFEIVLKENRIYMRFFTGAMYEPKMFSEKQNKKSLFKDYYTLKIIRELLMELKAMYGQYEY